MTFSNHRPRSGQYTSRAANPAHESCLAACKEILDQIAARHDELSRKFGKAEQEPNIPLRNAQLQWCMQEFQQISALCADAVLKCEEALDSNSVDSQVARARLRAVKSRIRCLQ